MDLDDPMKAYASYLIIFTFTNVLAKLLQINEYSKFN